MLGPWLTASLAIAITGCDSDAIRLATSICNVSRSHCCPLLISFLLTGSDGFLEYFIDWEDLRYEARLLCLLSRDGVAGEDHIHSLHVLKVQFNARHSECLLTFALPIALMRRCVPPAPGIVPMATSGWPNLADSPA